METIIPPVDRELIQAELTQDKYVRNTRKGENEIYEVTAANSPNVMREIGRLRELSFRAAGGGTGKALDIDEFDLDPNNPYRQLIVWDPNDQEIIGGYRYLVGTEIIPEQLATRELFQFSDSFVNEYLPKTIELGRSFIQPGYQGTSTRRKGLYSLDNLWDGLGALMIRYEDCEYFFGKVTMYTTYNVKARNILLHFLHHFFEDPDHLVRPIQPLEYDNNNSEYLHLFDGMEYKEAYRKLQRLLKERGEFIPPLINSYMNISPSMRVFGTSKNPGFGGVEETGILIYIPDVYEEKIGRHLNPIRFIRQAMAQRFLPKWWRNKNKRGQGQ
jgi:hypothetical protein